MEKCKICNSTKEDLLFRAKNPDIGDSFDIVSCTGCGLVKTKQKGSDISNYYTDTSYYAKGDSCFNKIKKLFATITKVYLIERFKRGGKLLDVGCGDGKVLELFDNGNWKLYGIEPYGKPKNARATIHHVPFENTKLPDDTFDVITLWHVFEHIINPNLVLRELNRILKKNGLLFLSIPNVESFSAKLFKNNWFALYPPVHIFHYSIDTIAKVLEKSGFEVKKVDKFSWEYTPFVILQSLLNSTGLFETNFLYKYLRGSRCNKTQFLATLLLCLALLPLLLILTAIELLDEKGSSVVNIYAYKASSLGKEIGRE
ncbi:class I SAM-dependent methyltransferase [Patescibacteria group bacterium]